MKKIRYAVVGSGWISQIAFMPGVAQTGNSEMTAIVTGNRPGAEKLAKFKVPSTLIVRDEIPKGATGKLQRIGLAEKLGLTS